MPEKEIIKQAVEASPSLLSDFNAVIVTATVGVLGFIGRIIHKDAREAKARISTLEQTVVTREQFEKHEERIYDKLEKISNTVARIEGICDSRKGLYSSSTVDRDNRRKE